MKEIANMFGTEFVKNPTTENAIKGFFTNRLTRKDTSFSILGVRCNNEQSTGKRKMSPMQIYYFLQGYKINEASIEMKKEQQIFNTLYDDFYSEGVMVFHIFKSVRLLAKTVQEKAVSLNL